MKDIRRLRIAGTTHDQEIECCYDCPLFDDGGGWEYHSRCKLTDQDGKVIHAAYVDETPMILSMCPLPKVQRDEKMVKECRCYRLTCVHQTDDFDCSQCSDTPLCQDPEAVSCFKMEEVEEDDK